MSDHPERNALVNGVLIGMGGALSLLVGLFVSWNIGYNYGSSDARMIVPERPIGYRRLPYDLKKKIVEVEAWLDNNCSHADSLSPLCLAKAEEADALEALEAEIK